MKISLKVPDLAYTASYGVTWTPAEISTDLWLDASDETTLTGDPNVTAIADKSGNGRNFTKSGGGNITKSSQNSNTTLVIPVGSAAWLIQGAGTSIENAIIGGNTYILAVSFKIIQANPNKNTMVLHTRHTGGGQAGFNLTHYDYALDGNNDQLALSVRSTSAYPLNVYTEAAGPLWPTQTWSVASSLVDADNGTAANRGRLHKDGSVHGIVNTGTTAPGGTSAHALIIGSDVNTLDGKPSDGNIEFGELVYVGGAAATQVNHDLIATYLVNKWV